MLATALLPAALLSMALLLLALQMGHFQVLSKDEVHPCGKREPDPTARGEGRQAGLLHAFASVVISMSEHIKRFYLCTSVLAQHSRNASALQLIMIV
jgi:hypothetical protein